MKLFTPEQIQRVKEETDLVRLVAEDVELKKSGSAFKGKCPFHSEKSPSFQVVPAKRFYHCFGCGAHGDVIKWVMERDVLSFNDAMEKLTRRLGI
jgi:DNA primase